MGLENGWSEMLAYRYRHVDFKYAPKSANVLAHILATKTLKRGKPFYPVVGVPTYVEWTMAMEREREPDKVLRGDEGEGG
ncbi:hypothetical protein Gorai_013269, partial [Gossypium raimondii]|nr:hypothetical protein [Gossypium raimondii]